MDKQQEINKESIEEMQMELKHIEWNLKNLWKSFLRTQNKLDSLRKFNNGDTEKGVANCDNCKHNTVPLKNHPCKHCIDGVNFEQFE